MLGFQSNIIYLWYQIRVVKKFIIILKILVVITLVGFIFCICAYGCKKADYNQQPMANFTIQQTDSLFTFTDNSTDDKGITDWRWDITGNRQIDTSGMSTLSIVFIGDSLMIMLEVADYEGHSDRCFKQINN